MIGRIQGHPFQKFQFLKFLRGNSETLKIVSITDRRESFCFVGFEHGTGRPQCIFDMASSVTKATCCCSIGNAWGNRCEECPQVGTKEFQELCPGGSGYRPNLETVILEDINECEEYENICQNGHCTNTFGSFMCSCNEGFILDDTKSSCIGNRIEYFPLESKNIPSINCTYNFSLRCERMRFASTNMWGGSLHQRSREISLRVSRRVHGDARRK